MLGRIKYLNIEEGYGYIISEETGKEYRFTFRNAGSIKKGDRVLFEVQTNGKYENAVKIVVWGGSNIDRTTFHKMRQEDQSYYFTGKLGYTKRGEVKPADVDNVFDFAYEMAFTNKHRSFRGGGDKHRTNGEIFANAFQGKIAECAACNLFYKFDSSVAPDFEPYERGRWDSVDLTVREKQISVKSTKHFGQLLLLETKDWDEHGRYIPNIGNGICVYDYFLLVRIKPSCEDLLKQNRLLECDEIDRNSLNKICCAKQWEYDYAGFITHDELIQIINEQYILPKHKLLSGKNEMDAENYYVQAYDMHRVEG